MNVEDFNEEDDSNHLINVNIYDSHSSFSILRLNSTAKASDICGAIAYKNDLCLDDSKFHSLVLVVTVFNADTKGNIHCVRTLNQNECVMEIRGVLISKLLEKYNIYDSKEVSDSVRWFYKDIRTSPIDFGDAGEVCGEYSSDEEEEISHSDLAYLAKAERKGYLLKRSSKDQNLWRRWYCALTDHMWCVDINRDDPRAICIKLSGMIRYKQGNCIDKTETTLQTIIINSLKRTHFFRAFNLNEHRKWIDDLNIKTNFGVDNDYFSMAEVIICDEECGRIKRMHRCLDSSLDTTTVFDSLSSGQDQLIINSTVFVDDLIDTSSTDRPVSNLVVAVDELIDECEHFPSGCLSDAKTNSEIFILTKNKSKQSGTFSNSMSGLSSGKKPGEITDIQTGSFDHNAKCSLIHGLHRCQNVYHVLTFVAEVAYFREMFRHDLNVSTVEQFNRASEIFSDYLLLQIKNCEMDDELKLKKDIHLDISPSVTYFDWNLSSKQLNSVRDCIFGSVDDKYQQQCKKVNDKNSMSNDELKRISQTDSRSLSGLPTFWTSWYLQAVPKLSDLETISNVLQPISLSDSLNPSFDRHLNSDLFDEIVNHVESLLRA
jgi:hypothetical protein